MSQICGSPISIPNDGVPAGAVLKGGEILVDPHLEARGFWDVVNNPEAGTYRQDV
jgi:crotonobetainyl-CoA:carnitine CoA-transferase CaiB-like acyl-CoA transferase